MNVLKSLSRRFIQWAMPAEVAEKIERKKMKVRAELASLASSMGNEAKSFEIKRPDLLPGVIPVDAKQDAVYLATDAACNQAIDYARANYQGQGFPGYPYLASLLQRSEYRSPAETTAMEMTRKWVKLISEGDGDKSARIEKIEAEMKRHDIADLFRLAAEHDASFGLAHIFINMKGQDDDDKRQLPLIISNKAIGKNSLVGFKVIEPMWVTPYAYNSSDPTKPDFYNPSAWFVLGKQTHASRLLKFVSRPVPDILKPAYNFGGMSMTQLMEPYVTSWLETKNAVADLIHSYSTSGVMTNMENVLSGDPGQGLIDRIKFFVQMRKNGGVMVLDKDAEEFFQFNAPLSGLDKLQAQSQEHMAAPCHMPLVKLLGVTPAGLNASAEPEMDAWRDYVAAMQQNLFRQPLKAIIELIQLDQFGDIDPSIGFEFVPIEQVNTKEKAEESKAKAEAAVALIGAGVLAPEEERQRLASDPESGYTGINVDDVPEPPANPDDKPNDNFDGSDGGDA